MEDRFTYPANLAPEEGGGLVVSFPDIPEALTSGSNLEEALAMAEDCLEEAIAGRIGDGEDIPAPSRLAPGSHAVTLPAQMALKAALYLAMRERHISKAALASLMDVNEKEVRRILDPHHGTKLPTIEKALRTLGKRIHLQVA